MVKRSHDPGKGLWSIPGGLLEVGETIKDALIREVKEETGVDVKHTKIIDVHDLIIKDGNKIKYHYVLISSLATLRGGVLNASTDVEEVKWIPINEIKNLKVTKTATHLIKKIQKNTYTILD
jgi:ADP-ribose pyrophosphatase YjhB (NUDIX family)